jgi:hypothetical protein
MQACLGVLAFVLGGALMSYVTRPTAIYVAYL